VKGRPVGWQPEELAWIEARADWPRRELHRAFCAAWNRRDVSFTALRQLCKRRGWLTGRTGHFAAGHRPWSAWRKGLRHKGSEKGWFAPGGDGRQSRPEMPLGTERLGRSGYLERKIRMDGRGGERWRFVHTLRWEDAHGPVPPGHVLKCLDGDRLNTDPANWACIPRALLPRLAGGRHGRLPYDTAPPELRPALLAIARLEHAAREARTRKEHAE